MKLPSPTQQLLSAIGYLKRGIMRWKVVPCWMCGKRNRIDVWRLLMMRLGSVAKCGSCKTELVKAVSDSKARA